MYQQDWQEYFEAINGRPATPQEIQQAIATGEIVAPRNQQVQDAQEAGQGDATQAGSQAFSQTTQANYQQPQPNGFQGEIPPFSQTGQIPYPYTPYQKTPNAFVTALGDYFKWFFRGLYKPEATDVESHPVFGLITTIVTAFVTAGVLRNFIVDFVAYVSSRAVGGYATSYASTSGAYVHRLASETLGVGTYFIFLLLVLIGYFAPIALSRILKDASYPEDNYWKRFGRGFAFLPLFTVANLIDLLLSFFGGVGLIVFFVAFVQLVIFLTFMATVAIGANQGLAKLSKGLSLFLTVVVVALIVLVLVFLGWETIRSAVVNYSQRSDTYSNLSSFFNIFN